MRGRAVIFVALGIFLGAHVCGTLLSPPAATDEVRVAAQVEHARDGALAVRLSTGETCAVPAARLPRGTVVEVWVTRSRGVVRECRVER